MRNSISGIGGSLTALATPFRDMHVDWDALSRLAERQISRGTAALIVGGSTGGGMRVINGSRLNNHLADDTPSGVGEAPSIEFLEVVPSELIYLVM